MERMFEILNVLKAAFSEISKSDKILNGNGLSTFSLNKSYFAKLVLVLVNV